MSENEILQEIRRVREEHARECNFDVLVMFQQMRAERAKFNSRGWKVVPPTLTQETFAEVREAADARMSAGNEVLDAICRARTFARGDFGRPMKVRSAGRRSRHAGRARYPEAGRANLLWMSRVGVTRRAPGGGAAP